MNAEPLENHDENSIDANVGPQLSENVAPPATDFTGNDDRLSECKFSTGESASPLPTLKIKPQLASEKINVAAGGRLTVEREDMDTLLDDGEDLDVLALATKKIRKPHRREWFTVHKKSEIAVRLLQHKPNADGIETEYYYLAASLRAAIRDELTLCRVIVCYSFKTNSHFLWIVNVHTGLSWYESLQPLLAQSEEFFAANKVLVRSSTSESRYRIRFKPTPISATWPEETTEELLGEALGQERMITDANHPLYRDLVDGSDLG